MDRSYWANSITDGGKKAKSGVSKLRVPFEFPFGSRRVRLGGEDLMGLYDAKRGLATCLSPANGAELSSLGVCDEGWSELLYRGNDYRPVEGWVGRAPWLWPVAGRCYDEDALAAGLRAGAAPEECSWRWSDQLLTMPRHGTARCLAWDPQQVTVTPRRAAAEATLASDAVADRSAYPFGYRLSVVHELTSDGLAIRLKVLADKGNPTAMPFHGGCHFTFDFTHWWGSDWLNGRVIGLDSTGWRTNALMQVSNSFQMPGAEVDMKSNLLGDALFNASPSRPVRLVSPAGDRELQLSFSTNPEASQGDALWVTHRDPDGRFFCLEPWVGWPNAINTGRGRVDLEPGGEWEMGIHLAVVPSQVPQAPGVGVEAISRRSIDLV